MAKTAHHPVLVIMGVSGSGKSTVASLLAGRLGWDFAEGDDLHPASNVAKMHAGQPLTRAQLSADLCGHEHDAFDRTIDVRIARVRAKLGDDPKRPRWIRSIRGVGYLFLE